MKSTIDWNEIVPMLPKALRETLMLEAVSILSDSPRPRTRTPGVHPPRKGKISLRYWRDTPEGQASALAAQGRHYRINKSANGVGRQDSKLGRVWKLLVSSKNDHITYEGLASIAKGQKAQTAATISQLWSYGLIDVMVPEKKVAIAE
jgi:hypothetical protein